jgi:hypothetical protein
MPQPTRPQSTPLAAADAAALDLDALQTTEAVHESVRLASGRTVVVHGDGEGERVVLRAPSGEVELTVRLTAAGPVLSVAAVALELNAGRLSVDVDRMDLQVRGEVGVEVLGDVSSRVLGDQRTHVQGAVRLDAGRLDVHAQRGDVRIEAAEDVAIEGAAVRLNC